MIAVAAALVVCSLATWTDVRRRRIPNWLTLPALAAALVSHPASAAIGVVLLAPLIVALVSDGFIGGGDAKLIAATAAWLGGLHGVLALLIAVGCYLLSRRRIATAGAPFLLIGAAVDAALQGILAC